MREIQNVNVELFREAIEEWNNSPIRAELNLIKFDLGPELKEITTQSFMQEVESIPAEKESMVPPKVVEIYNHLFDPEYSMDMTVFNKKEEVKMSEETVTEETVTEPVAEAAVEKPVKEKKERKPREPKAPKEPKEVKPREKKDLFESPSAVTRILMIVCENPDITNDELKAKLIEEGVKVSDGTILIQSNDTRKTIAYLRKMGKLQ